MRTRLLVSLALSLLLVTALLPAVARGDDPAPPVVELNVTEPGRSGWFFGTSVATVDDLIVVGQPFFESVGRAFVFEPNGSGGWTETFAVSDVGNDETLFGWSVAVAGNRVVVGAPQTDDDNTVPPSAYVYEKMGGGWTSTQLLPADLTVGTNYGWSVATAGDRIAVGAPRMDGKGAVYVFEPDGGGGWSETKLVASDGEQNDRFGWAVAMADNRIAVAGFGGVYVYDWDGTRGWQESILDVAGARLDDTIAATESRVVVGTHDEVALVFTGDGAGGWIRDTLIASDGEDGDRFGTAVAIHGEVVAIGAQWEGDPEPNDDSYGAAYLFEDVGGEWLETKITPPDNPLDSQFGYAVALSDNRLVAGAPYIDVEQDGSAYVFDLSASPSVLCDGKTATLVGTPGDDSLVGTSGSDVIHGLGGNDVITGAGGDDIICGGDGDDTVGGSSGDDTLFGGEGRDRLKGHGGNDTLWGEQGFDTLIGGDGDDTLWGGPGQDQLWGRDGDDTLDGGDQNDYLNGEAGADLLYGGDGRDWGTGGNDDDRIYGEAGADRFHGGSGNDRLYGGPDADLLRGGPGDDRLLGQHGLDTLRGQGGDDSLLGGAQSDRLFGGTGDDSCDGGPGTDTSDASCEQVVSIP